MRFRFLPSLALTVVALLFSTSRVLAVTAAIVVDKTSTTPGAYSTSWPDRLSYIRPGATVTLRVSSAPTGSTYQWYFNGTALSSATSSDLTLTNAATAHSGNYVVRATTAGTVSESNTLTINVLPVPTPSVVDSTYTPSASLAPASDATYYGSIYPLRDGGAIVVRSNFVSVGVYVDYYRLQTSGAAADPFLVSSTSVIAPGPGYAAILDDGSLLMTQPPYRILGPDRPVAGFSTLSGVAGNPQVTAGALQSDDKLLVAFGSTILRFNADGSRDTAFSYAGTALPSISALKLDSSGRIYVTGGAGNADPAPLIRLTSTGAVDSTFTALSITNHTSLILLNDGTLLLPGDSSTKRHYDANGAPLASWDLASIYGSGVGSSTFSPNGDIYVAYTNLGILRYHGGPVPQLDSTFFAVAGENTKITSLAVQPDGQLLVATTAATWENRFTPNFTRLDPSRTPSLTAPVIARPAASSAAVTGGAAYTVRTRALGTGPLTYTWLSLDGGILPADTTSDTLSFPSFQPQNVGRYQLRVSGPGGTALSPVIDLRPTWPSRLRNLSSRANVGGGEDVLIAGVTLATATTFQSRRLLLRGAGPALNQFGVQSTLPNPVLSFLRADGSMVDRNDDWTDSAFTENWVHQAFAFPFPTGSRDSIVINEASGGSYTVQLRDTSDRAGVGLIETYDVGDAYDPADQRYGELTNLSLRGKAGAGDASLIAGFIVDDPQNLGRPLRVLVRAIGPALAQFNVAAPLANPKLTLYNGSSAVLATNDDWSTNTNAAEIAATATKVGAFELPAGSKDSALLLDLPPGPYTAIVTDPSGATGIALIELYRVK